MHIACLHTAASNIEIFGKAAAALQLDAGDISHAVHGELLEAAEKQGGITPAIEMATLHIIRNLITEADAVLVTCSTLGAIADSARAGFAKPVLRTDRALAEQALESGLSVSVLCTAPTTLEPTTELFRQVFANAQAAPDIRLIDGAWDLFRAGEIKAYERAIADAANAAHDTGSQLVVLAQTSMANAAELIRHRGHVLDAPTAALRQLLYRA